MREEKKVPYFIIIYIQVKGDLYVYYLPPIIVAYLQSFIEMVSFQLYLYKVFENHSKRFGDQGWYSFHDS